jgi:ATP-dependent DNA ligase
MRIMIPRHRKRFVGGAHEDDGAGCSARSLSTPPEGDQWLHEIKFDGYRMHARLDRGAVKLLTRTGLDWTHKYPAIATAVSSLGARQADGQGRSYLD